MIENFFQKNPNEIIIAKPHHTTRCEGIEIITNKNKNQKIKDILKRGYRFIVLQKYLINTTLR